MARQIVTIMISSDMDVKGDTGTAEVTVEFLPQVNSDTEANPALGVAAAILKLIKERATPQPSGELEEANELSEE
jgi:hypothetical protein